MKRIKLEHEKLPGLRIIKTVFALFIVLLISVATDGFLPPYDLAVVAVLAMQDDMAKSFKQVQNRMASTLIGGLIGTIAMAIGSITNEKILQLILVPVGIFLILYFCSKLINRAEFIIIACYVFLSITLEQNPELSWFYPIKVMVTTVIASHVAILVNLYDPRRHKRVTVYKERK